jgi:hypothetical protein
MTSTADAYRRFANRHRNVAAPPKSDLEKIAEALSYYAKLPPSTLIKQYALNYGSRAGLHDDNITQPDQQSPEEPDTQFTDLPLFQKP